MFAAGKSSALWTSCTRAKPQSLKLSSPHSSKPLRDSKCAVLPVPIKVCRSARTRGTAQGITAPCLIAADPPTGSQRARYTTAPVRPATRPPTMMNRTPRFRTWPALTSPVPCHLPLTIPTRAGQLKTGVVLVLLARVPVPARPGLGLGENKPGLEGVVATPLETLRLIWVKLIAHRSAKVPLIWMMWPLKIWVWSDLLHLRL